jgi:hypothetical protein
VKIRFPSVPLAKTRPSYRNVSFRSCGSFPFDRTGTVAMTLPYLNDDGFALMTARKSDCARSASPPRRRGTARRVPRCPDSTDTRSPAARATTTTTARHPPPLGRSCISSPSRSPPRRRSFCRRFVSVRDGRVWGAADRRSPHARLRHDRSLNSGPRDSPPPPTPAPSDTTTPRRSAHRYARATDGRSSLRGQRA